MKFKCPICKQRRNKKDKICADCRNNYVLIDLKTGKKLEVIDFPYDTPVLIGTKFNKVTRVYDDVRKKIPVGKSFLVFQKYDMKSDIWFSESVEGELQTKCDFTFKELKQICKLIKKIEEVSDGNKTTN